MRGGGGDLTVAQLAVLQYADGRAPAAPWFADRDATEQCFDMGLVEPIGRGLEPPDTFAYALTVRGRGALEGGRA